MSRIPRRPAAPPYTPTMQRGVALRRGTQARSPLPAPALTSLAWAAGLVTTALILGTPYLLFGYYSPTLHIVLDSVDACVALLLAYLLYGRYTRSRRLQDLLLAQGLLLLGIAGLGVSMLIAVVGGVRPLTIDVWSPTAVRLTGALFILVAALAGDRPAPRSWRHWTRLTPWLALLVAVVALWVMRDQLPAAVDQSPPESANQPVITGHAMVLITQGFTAVCFFVASLAFARQAAQRHDELLRWLGPACALLAFARVNYVLFPSLYSNWVYTGDLLRTAGYAVLLVGAAREIGRYWSAQARAAVLEDRRRLARELHDGVVQELGYIRAEAHTIPSEGPVRERILGASDRALDEARAAIDALGTAADEPLAFMLHRAAQQVADRYGGRVVVDLDDTVEADAEQRHALVRITREAVSNALRHGGASRVTIHLVRDDGNRSLVVQDDGNGFDVEEVPGSGYGLTSMRERAAALPGSFDLSSGATGTKVEVTW